MFVFSGHHYNIDTFTVHEDGRFVSVGNLLFGFGLGSRFAELSESNRWLGRPRYLYAREYLSMFEIDSLQIYIPCKKNVATYGKNINM